MRVWRTIDNFFTEEECKEILYHKNVRPFVTDWRDLSREITEDEYFYRRIIEEIELDNDEYSRFANLDNSIGWEQWMHDPDYAPLPPPHFDKDEVSYSMDKALIFPLCSVILYLKVENLIGAKLQLPKEGIDITPETGKLVLMAPGVYHMISPYHSGKRISLNLNFWDKKIKAYVRT